MTQPKRRAGKVFRHFLTATAALTASASMTPAFAGSITPQQTSNRPTAPVELMNLRTPQSQTFLNPDGTYTTKITPQDRFYQDPTGQWHNINDQLVQSSDPNYAFQNAANSFSVKFSGRAGNRKMVVLDKNGDEIAFGLNGVSTSATPSVQGSEVTFSNVLPNTDATYTTLPDRVKEALVLRSAQAASSYSFTLNVKGVTYKQHANGDIEFDDAASGDFVALIPAPTAYDAAGAQCPGATQSISTNADGTYTLTVSLDQNWLNDPTRSFPVTLDPTAILDQEGGSADTFISSTYPSNNYSTLPSMDAGYSSYYGTMKSLLDFPNLSALQPGATGVTIQSARLKLDQYFANEASMPVTAYPITSTWNASTVTYSSAPTIGSNLDTQSAPSDTTTTGQTAPQGIWWFNVTNAVKNWYSAKAPQYGFELTGGTNTYAQFSTIKNAQYPIPELDINYTVQPTGDEPFWVRTSDGVNVADGDVEQTAVRSRPLPIRQAESRHTATTRATTC